MFNMYWIFTLLLMFLEIQSLTGKCTGLFNYDYNDRPAIVECTSVDEEEMLSFINGKTLGKLKIENSFIPRVEIFPTKYIKSLTIRNSWVKTFLSAQFYELRFLDLSFNGIREIDFSKNPYLGEIVMHHNQIEFLNGSNIPHSIEKLDLSYNSIEKFTKLECGRLKSLNLSHNSIERLADLLTDLKEVKMVDLSFNKLTNVNTDEIGHLETLLFLSLSHNDIQTIQYTSQMKLGYKAYSNYDDYILDLSFNKMNISNRFIVDGFASAIVLKSINLENNNLKDLNFLVSNEERLIWGDSLIVRRNKISKLLPLNFRGIKLVNLDLSLNEIEHVAPSTFQDSEITELCLDRNKLTSFGSNFKCPSRLLQLNLSFNPLTIIDEMSFRNACSSLRSIDLSHCLLRQIPVGLFKNLKDLSEVYLSHNEIEVIESNTFSHLKELDLSYNRIKNLPANVFSGLEISITLDLSHNPLQFVENSFNNTRIRNVSLNGISLTVFSEKELRGLEQLEYLDLSNTSIVELSNNTFDQLSSLEKLILDNNSIKMIPSNFFGFNTKLMYLSIIRNPISTIHFDSFPHKMKLKYLYLTLTGKIIRKCFFNLIFLEELHFVHSQVTEIQKYSFKGLINLKTLNFENSTVLKVDPGAFIGLTRLVNLDAQNLFANITTLKSKIFVGLKSLESLNVSSTGIGVIEDDAFLGLSSLSNLTLSHNKIGNLSKNAFGGLKKLKMLDLSYNNLTGKESTFPIGIFKDLIELTDLHLQHNRIIKVHIGEFSNLRNLRFLNLSHNQLSYLDRHLLFPLRKLEVLDINSNHVIKFDYHFTLKHLSSLKLIGIGENKWPCENMTIMLNDFEERGVNYREISKLEFEVENIGGIYCVHVCNYLYCPTEEDLVVTY